MKLVLVLAGLTIVLVAGRGVGVSARVWQRDGDRKAAVGLVARAIASYRFTGDAAGFFNPK